MLYNPNLKHNLFKEINEQTAYLLGYISTDGSLTKKKQYIAFSTSFRDKDILEKIKIIVNSNNKIGEYKNGKRHEANFSIHSKEIRNDLNNFGIFPNKTKNLKFITLKNKSLYPHYIRGIIDGDGCVGIINNKFSIWAYLKIASISMDFLLMLQNIIDKQFGFQKRIIYEAKSGVKYLNYYGKKCFSVIDWCYKKSNLYIDRKYKKYLQINEVYN